MNETLKSILEILEDGKPELQIAAVQVLGELRPEQVTVSQSLADRMAQGNDFLTRYILVTLGKIGTAEAVTEIVGCLLEGMPAADLAAHILTEMGAEVAVPLTQAFAGAAGPAQERILAILAKSCDGGILSVMEQALAMPELCQQAADGILGGSLEGLDGRKLSAFKTRLAKVLDKVDLEQRVLAQTLRVAGSLDATSLRNVLVKFTKPDQPGEVRLVAFDALAGVSLSPTQAEGLLEYLKEDDLALVVEPCMARLREVENWRDNAQQTLRKLLASRRQHLRLFALQAMRHVQGDDVVKPLVNHLVGPTEEMASAAAEALSNNPSALEPLLRSFQSEKIPEKARQLAIPLARLGQKLSDAQIKSLGEKGCKQLVAHDPMGEVLLDLLMTAQPTKGPALAVDKALRMRRARKLPECLTILVYLAQGRHLDDEGSYQLALARLLIDGEATLEMAQVGDATMGYFAKLVRTGFPVSDRLKKEAMLSPEALLRVGSHFADSVSSERRFGAELLQFLAEKHSKNRAGEEAMVLLKTGGLI